MKLISKTHDYYDGLFYPNDTQVFVRKNTKITIDLKTGVLPRFNTFRYISKNIYLRYGIIGFCGDIIPFIELQQGEKPRKVFFDHKEANDYCDWEAYDNEKRFYSLHSLRKIIPWLKNGEYDNGWFNTDTHSIHDNTFLRSLFLKRKIAYYCIYLDTIDINKKSHTLCQVTVEEYPVLKELNFYRMFDIYSTYQKIDMYVNNNLAFGDHMKVDPIPDVIKAQSKGFNEFSFRKEKTKGTKRRKRVNN